MNEKEVTKHYHYKNYRIEEYYNEYGTLQKVCIFKDDKLIKEHIPGLDGEVSLKEDILVVTSDGQTWVYSFEKEKELLLEQDIVTFDHKVYVNDMDITIVAEACYWCAEDYKFNSFILIDRQDMKVIVYIKDGERIIV